MNRKNIYDKISKANILGPASVQVQNSILPVVVEMGFEDEAKGHCSIYLDKLLRPDYFLDLGRGSGALLEVERGKITINNMDLFHFWNRHICEHSNFIFLMVPKELGQNGSTGPRKEFKTVGVRM